MEQRRNAGAGETGDREKTHVNNLPEFVCVARNHVVFKEARKLEEFARVCRETRGAASAPTRHVAEVQEAPRARPANDAVHDQVSTLEINLRKMVHCPNLRLTDSHARPVLPCLRRARPANDVSTSKQQTAIPAVHDQVSTLEINLRKMVHCPNLRLTDSHARPVLPCLRRARPANDAVHDQVSTLEINLRKMFTAPTCDSLTAMRVQCCHVYGGQDRPMTLARASNRPRSQVEAPIQFIIVVTSRQLWNRKISAEPCSGSCFSELCAISEGTRSEEVFEETVAKTKISNRLQHLDDEFRHHFPNSCDNNTYSLATYPFHADIDSLPETLQEQALKIKKSLSRHGRASAAIVSTFSSAYLLKKEISAVAAKKTKYIANSILPAIYPVLILHWRYSPYDKTAHNSDTPLWNVRTFIGAHFFRACQKKCDPIRNMVQINVWNGEIWAAFNRCGRSEVIIEQCRNARVGETGHPRENPWTSGIVRDDSHVQDSGGDPTGNRTRFTLAGGERRGYVRVMEDFSAFEAGKRGSNKDDLDTRA
ncbi:hypothetical protein PR048_000222 [Dryococelus australis]|uniref:Uncharacterized protein n=1 Tax=Dryococelus australis TaxID=614101 RepID=A0ABQ9IE18_9NEOP|nr:hypothetical protein PR048_000222 [Dryococelus australis]